jgi:hypothetical protein
LRDILKEPFLGGQMMSLNKEVWKKLESELLAGEQIAAKLIMPDVSKRLFIGLDSLKQHHILVSLINEDGEYNDSQSKGLSIVTKELVIKGNTDKKRYIDIVCLDPLGNNIFDIIGTEIAEGLDRGNPKEVVANVITKWRNFWSKKTRELLSRNEIVGIFAELWFLYYWLIPKVGISEAINRWRGPLLSRHDFEWTGKSVEVKATTNVGSRAHRIHGLEQLSPPQDGKLFLFSLRLREEQGASNTLPNLISICRDKLAENLEASAKFENCLAIAGYSPIYDEEYSSYKFRVVDEKLFHVTEKFPRIIASSFVEEIPSGVGLIEYDINLDGYDNLCIAKSSDNNIDFG